MKSTIHEIGNSRTKVVVIDDFHPNPNSIVQIAENMRPFPKERDFYYPGVRRYFEDEDIEALQYMHELIQTTIPFFDKQWGAKGLSLLSVGFSVVTTPPEELKLVQSYPHYDSSDERDIAILHYLNPKPCGGTAFYRHRATGIELITDQNKALYIDAFENETKGYNPNTYTDGSNDFFEEIARFDNVFNRALIYQGAILHSGIIENNFPFSLEPPDWRLTTTCFVNLEK